MRPATITVGDGCRLAWRMDGAADRPVLLLANSLGTDLGMWDAQLDAFAAHFRVLRYDSRGHGASDAPAGAYGMDRLGRDVVELLDALSIERVHVCGVSLGGMLGQWLGIRAPERVDRLALCNTSSYMGPPAGWDARIRQVLADGLAGIAEASAQRWFTPAFPTRDAAAVQRIRDTLLGLDPVGYAGCCAAIRDMDMRRAVRLIERPTLVLGGLHDPATPPQHSEQLAASVAQARLQMLPAAHLSNVECPEAFNQAVLSFLLA